MGDSQKLVDIFNYSWWQIAVWKIFFLCDGRGLYSQKCLTFGKVAISVTAFISPLSKKLSSLPPRLHRPRIEFGAFFLLVSNESVHPLTSAEISPGRANVVELSEIESGQSRSPDQRDTRAFLPRWMLLSSALWEKVVTQFWERQKTLCLPCRRHKMI